MLLTWLGLGLGLRVRAGVRVRVRVSTFAAMLLTAANWPSPRRTIPGSTALAMLTTVEGKACTREWQACLGPCLLA